MTQRDWLLNGVLVFILAGFGLIAYGFWRGRRAAAPPGRDVEVWWAQLMRVEAVVVICVLAIFLTVLASGASAAVFVSLMAATYVAAIAYAWKTMRTAPARGGDTGARSRGYVAVILAALLLLLILVPLLVRT